MTVGLNRRNLLGLASLAVLGACAAPSPARPYPTHQDSKLPVTEGVANLGAGENLAKVGREPASKPAGVGAPVCALAASLLPHLDRKGNLLFSPLSLALPLAMLANGARGQTLAELTDLLGGTGREQLNAQLNTLQQTLEARSGPIDTGARKGEVNLAIANSLWVPVGWPVHESFLRQTTRWYGAGLHGLDFGASTHPSQVVNDWVAEHTNGRIENLLARDDVTTDTRLVLVNTVWLLAPWAREFIRQGALPFTREDGQAVPAERLVGDATQWAEGDGWQAAAVDYLGGRLAMGLVLPDKGRDDDLLAHWASGGLAQLLTQWQPASVHLEMPTWRHEAEMHLVPTLQAIGIRHLFVGQSAVDLTGISPQEERLEVSEVVQRTWIEVDEKGTEAAAATAVVAVASSAQVEPIPRELVLDRPFWYVIFDRETACPVFVGRVADPTS